MAIIKLSRVERRRISAFFTCLVLAVVAWIFVTMSNNYTFPVKVALNYKNQPLRKAFYALQADTVTALVSGTGWQKLFANITSTQNRRITVDLKKLETQNFIVLSNQLPFINQKSDRSKQIISFNPDTVYFDFTARKVKRVPVKLQYQISYQNQYARSDDISLKPDFVTVSGPAAYVDSVSSWKTDSLIVKKANANISAKLNLFLPKENNVSIYPKTIAVTIPVDEFTEKTLEIPIKLINNKSYSKVTLFPKKVKVTFTVSLNNYSEVNTDFFEAVADLDDWQKNGLVILPVKLKQQPDYCKIVSIQPNNVNFIVRK
ncbi:CdaR family protein [Mucilaginibacter arboris]|uniref:YbbR-like domain-containing protein n=1 Tax=Mucilaginibacter arboris TaxID=2682090 RepID=A0A7K1SZP2_9SPHI|nr:YbbR-like domain-containing protein [Mucilaginibacter arboris]MVN22727.1 YbbR-like domain-containing protein [Mucilaginibacter arboris]